MNALLNKRGFTGGDVPASTLKELWPAPFLTRTLRASLLCGALATSLAGFLFTLGAFGPLERALLGVDFTPAWTQWTGAAILGLGLAWTTVDINAPVLKSVVAGAALLETAALAWCLHLFGVAWPPFTALAAGALAVAFGFIYTRTAAGARKRLIEGMFGGRISPATYRKLLESDEPLDFSGERREASVVVCEIFNRELLAEVLAPEDYVALQNAFLRAGAEVLMAAGGILDPSKGENLLALFGVPLTDPGHAARACEAAEALSHRLETFCRECVERWKAAPDYRIGVNSGEMIAAAYGAQGPEGSHFLSAFSVAGEPLDFCRRLCMANRFYGSRILLGPRAFTLASEAVEVRPIELIRSRGQEGPQEIYELLAPKNRLTPEDAERRDLFWKGVILFRARQWEEAAGHFQAVLNGAGGEDAPARFYLERIAHARESRRSTGIPPSSESIRMKRAEYPTALRELVAQLKRMPGIGPRSAERIALWMVSARNARPGEIAGAIAAVTESIRPCRQCGFFTTEPLCEICADETRAPGLLCVVEQATDILPLERTGTFRGRYHALGGRISPLDHVGPEDLRIDALLERVRAESPGEGHPAEVILALGADVEGEATANYLAGLLREYPVQVTRIAQGLPAGGGLEHADELTLSRALSGRVKF